MQRMLLEILEAATGILVRKIWLRTSTLWYQTQPNFQVENLEDHNEDEHNPSHLFCNLHPYLMFNRVMTTSRPKSRNSSDVTKSVRSSLVKLKEWLIGFDAAWFRPQIVQQTNEFDSIIHRVWSKKIQPTDSSMGCSRQHVWWNDRRCRQVWVRDYHSACM